MVGRTLAGSLGLTADWNLGEDNWKDGMDSNLLWLSVLTQGRFIDQIAAEPGAPVEGDVYVLAASHATHPNELAVFDEGAWHYRTPLTGWRLYNVTLGLFAQFNGTTWANDSGGVDAEAVRDIMAAALTSGTNVSIVPDDAADTITINAASGSAGLTAEDVMDTVAAMLQQGSNVTLTYNDGADTLTVAAADAAPKRLTVENDASAAYAFVLADAGKHKRFTAAGAVAATVPPDTFAIGDRIRCTAAGAGGVTVSGGAGVILNSRGGALTSAGQFAVFEIECVAANGFDVLGDLIA